MPTKRESASPQNPVEIPARTLEPGDVIVLYRRVVSVAKVRTPEGMTMTVVYDDGAMENIDPKQTVVLVGT